MNLLGTIKRMITTYPSLFSCREHCLGQLFLVIGNGYDWGDGELVYHQMYVFKDLDLDPIARIHKDFERDSQPDSPVYQTLHPAGNWHKWVKRYEEDLTETQKIIDEVDIRSQPLMGDQQPTRCYPISKNYSGACTVPDNVKQDWLDGAYEALEMAIRIGTKFPDKKRGDHNPKTARETIAKLDKRFPNRKANK